MINGTLQLSDINPRYARLKITRKFHFHNPLLKKEPFKYFYLLKGSEKYREKTPTLLSESLPWTQYSCSFKLPFKGDYDPLSISDALYIRIMQTTDYKLLALTSEIAIDFSTSNSCNVLLEINAESPILGLEWNLQMKEAGRTTHENIKFIDYIFGTRLKDRMDKIGRILND